MPQADGIVGEFFACKRESGADLLAMQVGDFYEFFGEDAEIVGRELDLKVSEKSSGNETYPMAGVPVDDLEPYLRALVERGYRVGVADQHEDGSGHSRAVTRVVTPGTLLDPTEADARYLAAIVRAGSTDDHAQLGDEDATYGLALVDVTTGRFVLTHADGSIDDCCSALYRFSPVELLPGPGLREDDDAIERLRTSTEAALTVHESGAFEPARAARRVRQQFGEGAIDSVGIDADDPAVQAAGAALAYVEETGTGVLASITRLQSQQDRTTVTLDATTQRNLELVETMSGEQSGSLVDAIDESVTSAGGRLLREWLTRPIRDRDRLERRLDSVEALTTAALAREQLRETLGDAYDLERLASRATSGSADARALVRVRESLAVLPAAIEVIEDDETLSASPLAGILDGPDRDAASRLCEELDAALREEPPSSVSEGNLIRRGYDDDLDELIERHERLRGWFDDLADRIGSEHGLTHVTVDRNKTDGYYVQVGKSEADQVPDRFERVKTLKNSERFTTEELEERERELLRVEQRRHERERELFEKLRERVADDATVLQEVGRAIARTDVLASFASHAVESGWTRPELRGDGDPIDIDRGRHPVVERTTEFVPNDTRLGVPIEATDPGGHDGAREPPRFLIVTGPNMSGKSTYMRQTALIVLLAQIGSFVPAESATLGLVDGIFTRVGALDELAQGRSTFMVEMQELSNILHSATEESLVILDEVGRGTATYDGISIAWAATEYLHNEIAAWTLFATHYHELTALADHLPRVANVHVAADETDGDVTFLRTIRPGPTDRSYGIHVADLAGVPDPVVDRARTVLDRLREEKAIEARGSDGTARSGDETRQVVFDLDSGRLRQASTDGGDRNNADDRTEASTPLSDRFGSNAEQVLESLTDLDVDETPPVELLTRVQQWQATLDDE
jgi:DNA mismatch repair protein MutS